MIAVKTRVAPLTNQRIPRLELSGALFLSRLTKTVKRALRQFTTINSEVYLTDSQVVLTWIATTDKKYKQFVKNRVVEIRQYSNVKDWEYIQGKGNIAKLASRGCYLKTLERTKKWFDGPEWLLYNKEKWPTRDFGENEDKDEEEHVEDIQRGEFTAAYFGETESKIKLGDSELRVL